MICLFNICELRNILRWQTTFLSSQREKGISQIYQNVKLPLRVNLICARVRTNNIYGVEHKYSINMYRVKLYKRVYHTWLRELALVKIQCNQSCIAFYLLALFPSRQFYILVKNQSWWWKKACTHTPNCIQVGNTLK